MCPCRARLPGTHRKRKNICLNNENDLPDAFNPSQCNTLSLNAIIHENFKNIAKRVFSKIFATTIFVPAENTCDLDSEY
jgi:hypothetical protein